MKIALFVRICRVIFFTGTPLKMFKCGKPKLGYVMCIKDDLDTPNLI